MKKLPLIYIGRRVSGERVVHTFLDPKTKKEMCWLKVRYVHIGYVYEAEVHDKGVVKMELVPERFDPPVAINEDTLRKWELLDVAANAFLKRKRAANSARRNNSVKEVINRLKPILKNYDYIELQELIEYVVSEVSKEARQERNRKMNEDIQRVIRNIEKKEMRNARRSNDKDSVAKGKTT